MMFNQIVPPINLDSYAVYSSDTIKVDRKTTVTIPDGYTGVFFLDGKASARKDHIIDYKLIDIDKSLNGQIVQISWVKDKPMENLRWGFGNVNVVNEQRKQSFTVGANGSLTIQISSHSLSRFTAGISAGEKITIDGLKNSLLPIIKNIGVKVLADLFKEKSISALDASLYINDLKECLSSALTDNDEFKRRGIEIISIVVDLIYVNPDDVERIKRAEKLSVEVIDEDETQSFSKPDVLSQITALREDFNKILAAFRGNEKYSSNDINNLTDSYESVSDELYQSTLPLRDEVNTESFGNNAVTVRSLINSAKTLNDFIMPVARIYSDIEYNLIHKFKLSHENNSFIIKQSEYLELSDQLGTGFYANPNIVKKENGEIWVEMHPIMRFLKAGLPVSEAKKAIKYWGMMNKIRHRSNENIAIVEKDLESYRKILGRTDLDYFTELYDFFIKYGLCENN